MKAKIQIIHEVNTNCPKRQQYAGYTWQLHIGNLIIKNKKIHRHRKWKYAVRAARRAASKLKLTPIYDGTSVKFMLEEIER